MIAVLREIIGGVFILIGSAFFLTGAIGVVRLPTLFTRLHAASLCDTTGMALILIGLMVYGGLSLVTVKLVFLLLFLLFMGPVATHALAAAALQAGIKPEVAPEPKAAAKLKSPGKPGSAGKKRRN